MRRPCRHHTTQLRDCCIDSNTVHPWSLRFERCLVPTAACYSVQGHSIQLSERVRSEAWILRLLNPRPFRIICTARPLKATTAVTTMSLDCFPMQLQIIPYTGPPKPKLTSRRNTSKTRFNGQEYRVFEEDLSIGLAPVSHQAEDVGSASSRHSQSQRRYNVCILFFDN
jgi:hypothetical protein